MQSLRLLDLEFGGRPHAVGVYLVETNDGPALFDCGPASTLPALEAGLAAHGLELVDDPPPAALAHPPRPRGRRRDDRPQAPGPDRLGLRDRRAAPRRPLPARALGAAALRPGLRRALGRAGAGARGERAHRRRRRARLGGVPDPGARLAPRQLPPRRDAARGRRRRRAHARGGLRRAGVAAAGHRRRGLARHDPGDQGSCPGAPRADPLRRPRGRRQPPRPSRPRARPLGGARARRARARTSSSPPPRPTRAATPASTTRSRRSGSRGTACAATGTRGSRRRGHGSRTTFAPETCASASTTISSMFTCGGRVSANMMQSATSSACSGPPSATFE